MTPKLMHVKGTIVASNPEHVNEYTGHRIMTEMIRNRLVDTLSDPQLGSLDWQKGTITPDTHNETLGGRPAAMDFITRLHMLVTAPGIAALGMQGELMVTVEGEKEPVIFRVTVENGEVRHQQARLAWDDEPIAFM